MKRGEIWWAELPAPVGNRPVIILTRDAVLENIGSIVVALVTRTIRQLPTEVVLGRRQGLPVPCVANLDNILTVPRHRLTRLMGACDAGKIEELNQAIKNRPRRALRKNLNALHVLNEAGGWKNPIPPGSWSQPSPKKSDEHFTRLLRPKVKAFNMVE